MPKYTLDDFLEKYEKFYNKINDKTSINNEKSPEEFIKKYSNDNDFFKYLESFKFSLNEISEIISQINFEYDEYYNFASIKRMITYIVNNPEKYIYYSPFINLLLVNFKELNIKKKTNL